jgi:acyl-CoA thioesterase FadM
VYRYVSPVLDHDLGTLAAEIDPTAPGGGRHLNFDVILRRCGLAWMTLLKELGVFGHGVIVPRLEVDYHREVGAGELVIDVAVIKVGRTSFRLRLDACQDGELAARAEVVLVVFDYDGKTPLPLSPEQREALAPYVA